MTDIFEGIGKAVGGVAQGAMKAGGEFLASSRTGQRMGWQTQQQREQEPWDKLTRLAKGLQNISELYRQMGGTPEVKDKLIGQLTNLGLPPEITDVAFSSKANLPLKEFTEYLRGIVDKTDRTEVTVDQYGNPTKAVIKTGGTQQDTIRKTIPEREYAEKIKDVQDDIDFYQSVNPKEIGMKPKEIQAKVDALKARKETLRTERDAMYAPQGSAKPAPAVAQPQPDLSLQPAPAKERATWQSMNATPTPPPPAYMQTRPGFNTQLPTPEPGVPARKAIPAKQGIATPATAPSRMDTKIPQLSVQQLPNAKDRKEFNQLAAKITDKESLAELLAIIQGGTPEQIKKALEAMRKQFGSVR